MSEDLPRLDLLRFLERVQVQQLDQTRRWIHQEEQRLADLAARRPPPPPPDWAVEMGIGVGRPVVAVHQGWCPMTGSRTRPVPREQALGLIAEDTGRACQQCRPDTELGVL